jgi:hypothetical protein
MKEKRKFSGEFISEMESLNVLGGTAQPMNTNIGYKCITDNCNGGNCVEKCACTSDTKCDQPGNPCSSINSSGSNCPGPCVAHTKTDCNKN